MNTQTTFGELQQKHGHPWHVIWMKVLRNPSVATFEGILDEPNISAWRSSLWVVAALLVSAAILGPVILVSLLFSQASYDILFALSISLLVEILIGLLTFWVVVLVIQALALLIGGQGSFRELGFTYAAIYAMYCLIITPILFIATTPIGIILLMSFALYALILMVRATSAVNGFGQIKAAVLVVVSSAVGLVLLGVLNEILRIVQSL